MQSRWDHRFMDLAHQVATWSKDPSTKVGAVIVNPCRIVVGLGYNGFPRGVPDDPEMLEDRPSKYARTVHAEANAILNSSGPVAGSTIYVTAAPCSSCTALIIQARLSRVVHPPIPADLWRRWADSFGHARDMLMRAGITIAELETD